VNKEPVRIVVLTDFHFGAKPIEKISKENLQKAIDETNALYPDIIALVGDYIDWNPEPIKKLCTDWLSQLRSKYGIVAVLGNHDYKCGEQEMIKESLQNVGIKVLTNEKYNPLAHLSNFEIIGVGDISQGLPEFNPEKAFEVNNSETFKVLLSHNPKSVNNFTRWKVDLQISGHIHGGQIRTPSGYPILGYLRKLYDVSPSFLQFFIPHQVRFFNQLGSLIRSSLHM